MAKRFTDTFKWQRPWYRNLPPKYRELWNYILDMCDHAGIWYVDIQLAGLVLNFSDLDLGEAKRLYEKQIQVIDESRWFITDFIPFQYVKLTNSKFHISISTTLEKFNLQVPKGYGIPYEKGTLGTPLVKEKERVKEGVKKFVPPTPDQVSAYAKEVGFEIDGHKFCDHYAAGGWKRGKTPITDWKACVRTWKGNNAKPATQVDFA